MDSGTFTNFDSLIGAVIGGLITGIFMMIVTYIQHKNTLKQTSFNKYNEERVLAIKNIYSKLKFLFIVMNEFTNVYQQNSDPSYEQQKTKEASKAYNDFFIDYRINQIFFSESLCKLLEQVKKDFWEALDKKNFYGTEGHEADALLPKEIVIEKSKMIREAWEIVKDKIPPIIKDIKEEFRDMLCLIK